MANFARSKPESLADVLWLMMASFAMVLLIYVAACSVIFEFAYRHLVAAPIEWLMARRTNSGSRVRPKRSGSLDDFGVPTEGAG